MRRAAVVLTAVLAAGAVPVSADAGGRHKRAKDKAHVAKRAGKAGRGLPAAWRATGWTAAAPAPTAGAPAATPQPAPTATPAPTAAPALPAPNPRSVSVGATEFAFTLSQQQVQAGEVRIQLDNGRAEDPHDLLVVRGDDAVLHFGEQPAGSVSARKVVLDAGKYRLVCPLPRHEERGMHAELRVAAAGT